MICTQCITNLKYLKIGVLAMFAGVLAACTSTDVVESGLYQGTVHEVEANKSEIYVKTDNDQMLELYFTDSTKLTHLGEPAAFSALEEGQSVAVEVKKIGQRLDPISVDILE